MSTPIISLKIKIPTPGSDYLSRPRLNEKLNAVKHHAVITVVAPAGYGKTSLVSAWAQRQTPKPAWLSLQPVDAVPGRFWQYVSQALLPAVGPGVHSCFAALDPQVSQVDLWEIDKLIVALQEYGKDIVFVLDDLQNIAVSKNVVDEFAYFVDAMPENLHLVLLSRIAPPFRTMKLKASGRLLEITQGDLEFTRQESLTVLRGADAAISEGQVAQVFETTQGWAMGLTLARYALANGKIPLAPGEGITTGVEDLTSEYLLEEVIAGFPEKVQTFAGAVSCVDEFSEQLSLVLAQSVDESFTPQDLRTSMDYILRNNLFFSSRRAADRETWYTFHALFANALRQHVMLDADSLREANKAAAAWFGAAGQYDRFIHHAAQCGDYDAIRDLIITQWEDLAKADKQYTLLSWFSALPEDYILRYPKLCLYQVAPLISVGNFRKAQERYDQAMKNSRHVDDDFDATALALLCILRSVQGDASEAHEAAGRALKILPPENDYLRNMVIQVRASTLVDTNLQEAAGTYEMLLREMGPNTNTNVQCSALCNAALLEVMLGHVKTSQDYAYHARALYENESVPMLTVTFAAQAFATYLSGQPEAALKLCENYCDNMHKNYISRTFSFVTTVRSLIEWQRGNIRDAQSYFEMALSSHPRGVLDCCVSSGYLADMGQSHALNVAISQFDSAGHSPLNERYFALVVQAARGIMPTEKEVAEILTNLEEGYVLVRLRLLLLLANVRLAAGDTPGADAALRDALAVAEPEGICQPFLEESAHLGDRLRVLSKQLSGAFVKELSTGVSLSSFSTPANEEIELSARELDVIRLAAAGMSVAEIANALFVSRETAKKHLGNIYAKVGAHNRSQAIAILKNKYNL